MTSPDPSRPPVPPAPEPVGPVNRYYVYAARPVAILVGLLVLALVPQGLASWLGWPEKVQATILAFQMFLLGILLAPTLPIWRRLPRASEAPDPPPDSPTFRDGF